MVGAKHTDARSEFGTPERHHVLPDVGSHHLTMLRRRIIENPLNKIVAILVAGNIDQRNPGAIATSLADTVEIATQKV